MSEHRVFSSPTIMLMLFCLANAGNRTHSHPHLSSFTRFFSPMLPFYLFDFSCCRSGRSSCLCRASDRRASCTDFIPNRAAPQDQRAGAFKGVWCTYEWVGGWVDACCILHFLSSFPFYIFTLFLSEMCLSSGSASSINLGTPPALPPLPLSPTLVGEWQTRP